MKKIFSAFAVVLCCAGAFAQQVTSITIPPVTPADSVSVVVVTTFPGGPCSYYGQYPATLEGDTIVFNPLYCFESDGPPECTNTHTFRYAPLPVGDYVVRVKLTTTQTGVPCGSQAMFLRDIGFESFEVTATIDTTDTTGTGVRDLSLDVRISPNPANEEVFFSFQRTGDAQITLYDMSGKAVRNEVFKAGAEMRINIADLPANVYFYNITTGEQSVAGKILVE